MRTHLHTFRALLYLGIAALLSTNATAAAEHRRLLVQCPEITAKEYGVELKDLFSDIELGNVVDVVDENGNSVSWHISRERNWVVFSAAKNQKRELLIAEKHVSIPRDRVRDLPGMLTVKANGIWIREIDQEMRVTWFSNRIARVAGAVLETRGQAAVDNALVENRDQLRAMGVEYVTPGKPYESDRKLADHSPDFSGLLKQMAGQELLARASVFETARRATRESHHQPRAIAIAEVRGPDLPEGEGLATMMAGHVFFEDDVELTLIPYSLLGGALRVDGRDVAVIRPRRDLQSDGYSQSVSLKLKAGTHEIELIAQGKKQNYQAGLRWIPPGETQERQMTSADFAPAPRARITAFKSADHSKAFPLGKISRYGRTGFFEKARYWVRLTSFSGTMKWQVEGYSESREAIDIGVPEDEPITVTFNGEEFTIRLDESQYGYLGGPPEVQVDLPCFIFDNEELCGNVTLFADADVPLDINVTIAQVREQAEIKKLKSGAISLQASSKRDAKERILPGPRIFPFYVKGAEVEPGDSLHITAICPPQSFADDAARVLSPSDCAGVALMPNGELLNTDGERVIIKLTRPSLNDKRSWSLLSGLFASSGTPEKLLVIASPEEWGDDEFKSALNAAAERAGMRTYFKSWEKTPASVSRMQGTIGSIANWIQDEEQDGVLIIPPLSDLASGQNVRTLSRSAACLAEMSAKRYGRQRVWVALPPSYRPDATHSEPYEEELLRVVNDYGVRPIPLATWLETNPEKLSRAYDDGGIRRRGPVGMRNAIADFLITWIDGGKI